MMSNYALIENDVVINVIVWDGPGENGENEIDFGEGVTYVELPKDKPVSIGWTYKNGEFIQPPLPEPTKEELIALADQEKESRLKSADSVFLEWQTKLLLNIASDEEKQSVIAWVNYKDAVRNVDTQDAPDISWPEQPPIPEGGQ